MRHRPRCLFALLLCALPSVAVAQTYTWNNSGTNWNTPSSWTPNTVPNSTGAIAQFNVLGTIGATTINNPTLNAATLVGTLSIGNTASGSGWNLSGPGGLTAGVTTPTSSQTGVRLRGVGNSTIALGPQNESNPSFVANGGTGTTLAGAIDIGTGSTLTLSGNTIASVGSGQIRDRAVSVRGGTLVLDNSQGDPFAQRLTFAGTGTINLAGGGSQLQFRSDANGSTFTLPAVLSLGAGNSTVGLTGVTVVGFDSLSLANSSATVNFTSTNGGTLGNSGTSNSRIFFDTTTPSLINSVISDGSGRLGFALYQGTAFAGYTTNGIGAVATTNVSGELTSAANQNSRLTADGTIADGAVVAYNTLTLASADGVLTIGDGGRLDISGILFSGDTKFSILDGSIGGNSTRFIHVTNPAGTLSISSSLAGSNQDVTFSGAGFVELTGTTNQVGFTSNQKVNLSGVTLQVTNTNFDLSGTTAPTLQFRGGVIEYDVSNGSFSFNRALGTGAGNVNWGAGTATDFGSGGFSAFSSDPANTLTVNLGGSNGTVTWGGTTSFVQDGFALRFGSTASNATVVFDNPLALGGSSDYTVREISVTRGEGNVADKTQFARVISGGASTDLLKTGTGVLEFTANNTYAGNTLIRSGELRVTGQTGSASGTGTGNVVVMNGGLLSGSGQALPGSGNQIAVLSGGSIQADSSTGTGTLTVGNTVIHNGGQILANLGSVTNEVGQSNVLTLADNRTLDLKTASTLKLNYLGNFNLSSRGTFTIASLGTSGDFLLDNSSVADGFEYGLVTYNASQAPVNSGAVNIDVGSLVLQEGSTLSLRRSGSDLVLVFTPVPEPAAMLAVCGLVVGGVAAVRRWRRKAQPADVTPAA